MWPHTSVSVECTCSLQSELEAVDQPKYTHVPFSALKPKGGFRSLQVARWARLRARRGGAPAPAAVWRLGLRSGLKPPVLRPALAPHFCTGRADLRSCQNAFRSQALRLRKPTPKTIDHLDLGAPTPSKWKHAVKVDLRKLEA